MRRLLYRIILFSGFFAIFLTVFMALVAYTTQLSPVTEGYLFSQPGLWGGTYQRSEQLDEWLNQTNNGHAKGLLLGGSTVYRNINPYILSEKTAIDFFNAGSSSQTLANSSVLLQYAINSSADIQYVVVCVDHVLWDNSGLECSTDWLVNNYNPSSAYMPEMIYVPRYPMLLITYFYRLIKSYIPGSKEYVRPVVSNDETYIGKGFVCASDNMLRKLEEKVPVPEMSRKNYSALLEIVRICKERHIRLTLFNPQLLNAQYDLGVIRQPGVEIIDAASAPVDAALFYDNYHLYCKGTVPYTEWIADEFNQLHQDNKRAGN